MKILLLQGLAMRRLVVLAGPVVTPVRDEPTVCDTGRRSRRLASSSPLTLCLAAPTRTEALASISD
jgi:hypothetical protein